MFSQRYPGKPNGTDDTYEMRKKWFQECLGRISLKFKNLKSIAFPYGIGCGLAQGIWREYEAMIVDFAKHLGEDVDVQLINRDSDIITDSVTIDTSFDEEDYVVWDRHSVDHAFWPKDLVEFCEIEGDMCFYRAPGGWEQLHTLSNYYTHGGCKLCDKCYEKYHQTYVFEHEVSEHDETSDDSDAEMVTYHNTGLVEFTRMYTPDGWEEFFKEVCNNGTLEEIESALNKDLREGNTVYPPLENIYSAFEEVSLRDIKVIIIGQDPYHEPGQAHGMSFSVPDGNDIPSSLKNIYKEMETQGFKPNRECGDLEYWAQQGVFLINTALTVVAGSAGSHAKAWEYFTQQLMRYISNKCKHVAIILWGNNAKKLEKYFTHASNNFCILKSCHPSGLSAYQHGYFGNHHFTKANTYLKRSGRTPIDWNLVVSN